MFIVGRLEMALNQSSFPTFRVGLYMVSLMLLLFFVSGSNSVYTGSTIGLKEIFKGRCFEYFAKYRDLGLVDKPPTPGEGVIKYCEEVWRLFTKAFAFKNPLTLKPEDYGPFFDLTSGKSPIKDKVLFWSKQQALSLKISDRGKRAVVLADTLPGYLVDDLNWCGEEKGQYNPPNPDGINFHECPKGEYFKAFWGPASEKFAKRAQGIVHHLVNGTVGNKPPLSAYHKGTFFYTDELPNIDKTKVTEFRVIVANQPGQRQFEKCGTGTIKELQDDIKSRLGKDPKCLLNPSVPLHLMCADTPKDQECTQAIPYTNAIGKDF